MFVWRGCCRRKWVEPTTIFRQNPGFFNRWCSFVCSAVQRLHFVCSFFFFFRGHTNRKQNSGSIAAASSSGQLVVVGVSFDGANASPRGLVPARVACAVVGASPRHSSPSHTPPPPPDSLPNRAAGPAGLPAAGVQVAAARAGRRAVLFRPREGSFASRPGRPICR